ncbi:Fe(2+) transporter permease subunit FeoB [Azospirillum halopraeferens]|uniref:Fe(2+) transporter permease subunit FeoB n=1 Tax=Azospirillum halopraeferens TaxID=34010 RepID=UPI0003FCFBA6|nr:Fe(2+) transporter permease subunit FeoB [Azospirillum halopraeferens]
MKTVVVGVVGNPNCGKTTLFNALTGSTQHVGNWPGVTVEKKSGSYRLDGTEYRVVDLPGVYSLSLVSHTSEDERIAREYALSGEADLIVNIVDGSNLERNLYLTSQLLEMRVPVVVAVNMMDIARDRGIAIDTDAMAERLGCPVVPLVASRRRGLDALHRAVAAMAAAPRPPDATIPAPEAMEPHLAGLAAAVAERLPPAAGDPRWIATKLLEGDLGAGALIRGHGLDDRVVAAIAAVEEACGDEADIIVADARFGFITDLVAACVRRPRVASRTLSDSIDRVVLNRVLGIPVFLAVMYAMFLFTINIGGAFIDAFEQVFGALLVDGLGGALRDAGVPEWLVVPVADGMGGGIQTVATFVPVIGALFLFLSVLEDSGYMARAAFVMDRAMRAIGLPGKAFVPLIVGFGCNVPAIMATRTLENRRDRVVAVMMAPFMSCGARLPVYALFAVAFFPVGGQNVVFALYLIGLAFAVATGFLLKSSLLKGDAAPFVMELPPYHLPTAGTVVRRAWDRLNAFILRAGRFIVPMVMVLSVLSAMGTDGTFGHRDSRDSVLATAGRTIMPAFAPMGLTEDNWPAGVGLFTGIFAKEAVVGTLNTLYSRMGGEEEEAAEDKTLGEALLAAVATIPENLAGLATALGDPLGLDLSYTADPEAAAEELEVGVAAFGAMVTAFDGAAGAFAYMLLILLYMPCVAALGAMYDEVGWRWAMFSAVWTTGLGYTAAVIFYQASRLSVDPASAILRIAVALAVVATAGLTMWLIGNRRTAAAPPVPAE